MKDLDYKLLIEAYDSILNETPIASFNLEGEWKPDSKPRGYDKASRGILTSEKGVEKIKKLWNKIPIDVDIYMVSSKHGWKHTEIGRVDQSFIKDKLKLDIPINDENATIFYTNNKGSEKIPTTAWTLAHRFGHALRREKGYSSNYHYVNLNNYVEQLINKVGNMVYRIVLSGGSSYNSDDRITKREIAAALGTFKSARDRNLRNYEEFTNELIAQYIITGKIQFNRDFPSILPKRFAWGKPQGPYKRPMEPELLEEFEEYIEQMENTIYYACDELVHSAAGNIYVM